MESAEHVWIGDQVRLKLRGGGTADAKTHRLTVSEKHSLTYGQIIALAGDLYGEVGSPISTAEHPGAAFISSWRTLADGDAGELREILAVMDEEIAAVEAAVNAKRPPSDAYRKLGDSLSAKWNRITGGGSFFSDFFPRGRYLMLSSENWDHFNFCAEIAYRAGHDQAMRWAATAIGKPAAEQERMLSTAYAMNAFADHFLTDMFSAGHVRAPRKALTDLMAERGYPMACPSGGLLTRTMHDEDGAHGLRVTNRHGTEWKAYGDKKLRDECSAANREQVILAAQASADDVWNAFSGQGFGYSALNYVPDFADATGDPKPDDPSPLFTVVSAKSPVSVSRRRNMADAKDTSRTTDWNPADTLLELFGGHPYQTVRCFDPYSKKSLGWLTMGGNNYVQLRSTEQGAHRCSWYVAQNGDLYLRKETSGTVNGRYLSWEGNSADWELNGSPVMYHSDGTITLKSYPNSRLCVGDNDWVYWTYSTGPDAHLVAIDLPIGPSITP